MPVSPQDALARRPRIALPGYEKLPLPYVAGDDPETPARQDAKAQRACAKFRRCSACGTKIVGDVTFVSDASLVELVDGKPCQTRIRTVEPPLHESCAVFSMKACPHLRTWTATRQYLITATGYSAWGESERKYFDYASRITLIRDAKTGEVVYSK